MFPSSNPSFLSFTLPSGNVTQSFAPFFSQQVDVTYQGNPGIEQRVITEAASFGKQIGRILDVVVRLSEGREGEAFEALRTMAARIEAVKADAKASAERGARDALAVLGRADPDALRALLDGYPRPAPGAAGTPK